MCTERGIQFLRRHSSHAVLPPAIIWEYLRFLLKSIGMNYVTNIVLDLGILHNEPFFDRWLVASNFLQLSTFLNVYLFPPPQGKFPDGTSCQAACECCILVHAANGSSSKFLLSMGKMCLLEMRVGVRREGPSNWRQKHEKWKNKKPV